MVWLNSDSDWLLGFHTFQIMETSCLGLIFAHIVYLVFHHIRGDIRVKLGQSSLISQERLEAFSVLFNAAKDLKTSTTMKYFL